MNTGNTTQHEKGTNKNSDVYQEYSAQWKQSFSKGYILYVF